jgi:hypothetical protein
MATDRSISIYIDSTFAAEKKQAIESRIGAACAAVGASIKTHSGSVTVGSRADNLTFVIGSGGSNSFSVSILVDSAVTHTKWATLVERILQIMVSSASLIAMTTTLAYSAGGRADRCTFVITV